LVRAVEDILLIKRFPSATPILNVIHIIVLPLFLSLLIPYLMAGFVFDLLLGPERSRYALESLGWRDSRFYLRWLQARTRATIWSESISLIERHVNAFITWRALYSLDIDWKLLCRLKGEGLVFVDVGANIGQYVLRLHRNFRTLIALEPHPANFQILAMLKGRRMQNVAIMCCAASDTVSEVTMRLSPEGWVPAYGHSIVWQQGGGESLRVPAVTLDSILADYAAIDLIKIDVEGVEWLVLRGAESTMKRVRAWIIEVHNHDDKLAMESYLRRHGYETVWRMRNPRYPLYVYARKQPQRLLGRRWIGHNSG
jgi:FkbM family methyltransferase